MVKIFKNITIKVISIIVLVVGGCFFLISIPKVFVKTIDFLFGGLPEGELRNSEGEILYQEWRDNVASFGDRKQFTILKGYRNETNETIWDLYDLDNNKNIDEISYYTKSSSCIYALGKNGYIKLNFKTAEIQKNENIIEFSEEDQKIFQKLESKRSDAKDNKEKAEISWNWINS